jgi:type II secretory pathway pseudopilin PulG
MMLTHVFRQKQKEQGGFILPGVLALIIAASILGGAVLTVILNNFFVVGNNVQSQQAFNIAEAGINYYLWHMAHNGTDYKDGQTTPTTPDATLGYGPYVHNYTDTNVQNAGTYTLWIKPQGNGSTIASVRSIGKAAGSNITRTVQAQIGAASFASYGLVADTEFWFGSNESANGPIFSNVGVHMDGPSSDTVGSANASYVPQPKYGGDNHSHPGVWCDTAVTTPNCNTRDKSNWLYPKTSVDFNQVTSSLCTMKKTALADYAATASIATQATACSQTPTTRTNAYIPQYATNGTYSSTRGYLIQLNTNGTYDLYKVNSEDDQAATYNSALSTTAVATGIAIPPSGVIFTEDNVWVRTNPSFHGRVSIAAGRLANNNSANITIADDMVYSTKNGSDAIGLIAENDVLVAPYAPPASGGFNFEIDAAALAQSGSVTWPEFYDGTSTCTRGWTASNQTFTFYGSVATRQDWTWNYTKGACGNNVRDGTTSNYYSGIERTNTAYDYNLLYAPPPSYPVTGSYDILSWREVLTKP